MQPTIKAHHRALGAARIGGTLLAMVMGFYTIGYFVGPYLLRDGILDSGMIDRHTIGLLSVIVSIWLYEHQRTDARWDRLNQIMGR